MKLTDHDLRVLRLASQDLEGRISFFLTGEGVLMLAGDRGGEPVPAEGALSRLEASGLLRRALNRSFVLTPQGWDTASSEDAAQWMEHYRGA